MANNATSNNTLFTVGVSNVSVVPTLVLNTKSADSQSAGLLLAVSSNSTLTYTVNNQTVTSTLTFGGVSANDSAPLFSAFAYNIPTKTSDTLGKVGELTNVVNDDVIAKAEAHSSVTYEKFDFESLPIISVNGQAVLSFDEWWSMFNTSNIESSFVSQIKSKLMRVYPKQLVLNENDPDFNVLSQLKASLLQGHTEYNNVLGILTSQKIGDHFLNPDKVMFSKWLGSYPLSDSNISFTLNSISNIGAYLIKRTIHGTDFFGAFSAMNAYPDNYVSQNQNWWSGAWWDLNNGNGNVYLETHPSTSNWQSTFAYSFSPTMTDGASTFGMGLFYYLTSQYAQALDDPIINSFSLSLTPDIPQTTASSTLFDPEFYNSQTGSQVIGSVTMATLSFGQAYIYVLPFDVVNPVMTQIGPSIPLGISDSTWTPLYGQAWTIVELLAHNTGEQAVWNIVGNLAQSVYNQASSAVEMAFTQLGFTSNSSATGIDADSSELLYFTDSIMAGNVSDYLYMPGQATQVAAVAQHDYHINLSIDIKELETAIDNPFDAMADKVLTLRDHFNAKVLNDINCKVMNLPNVTNVASNYQTYINQLNDMNTKTGEISQSLLYALLAPIFYGALQTGTYYSVIDDMYNMYPYTATPSSIQLAYEYANNYLKIGIPFPFSVAQLNAMVEWFFLYPSPTSVKADRMQVITYKPSIDVHAFKTSEKKINAYLPHHVIMMDKLNLNHSFDPSVIEVRDVMDALEEIATTFTLLGSMYTVSRSAASMISGIVKRAGLSNLEEVSTSNDPNIQSMYKRFQDYWSNMLHSKSNIVSSQEDKYKHFFFIPDSKRHKDALAKSRSHLSSITDAIMLGTFRNSDLTQQLGQFALNTTAKHKTLLYSVFGKLGTDLISDNALKLLDHAIEDVVKDTVDIAVDVAKVMLNMVMDIGETVSNLVSPVSVITRLWTDVTEKVYNSFNNSPDMNSVLFSSSAGDENKASWVIQFPCIPEIFSQSKSGWSLSQSLSDVKLQSGGFVSSKHNANFSPVSPTEFNTSNSSLPPKTEYIWYYTLQGGDAFPIMSMVAPTENTKPIRYKFHTTVGDAYVYLMFNSSYQYPTDSSNGTWSISTSSDPAGGFLGGFYLSVEPVKDDMGIVNPLLTYKRLVEVIYQLPKLFNCIGLLDYYGYKDLWTNFISSVGSQAWANTQQHISVGELLAADAGESALIAGFTGYAVSDGLSGNWSGVISNGVCAAADTVSLALYTSKVEQINSEPNIFSYQSNVQQLLNNVVSYILLWNYMMHGGYLEYFRDNADKINKVAPGLVSEYEKYCAMTLDNNERNRKLDIIMNDHFYPYFANFKQFLTDGLPTSFFPDFGDHIYNTDLLNIHINPEAHYHWIDKQVAYIQGTTQGTLNLMFPIYSPSIVEDFMYFASALGRIAAGAFIEKKVAKVFASHLKTSKKIAWLMSKVDPFINKAKKLGKWLNAHAWAKYHRDHNSKSRAKLINAQTTSLEGTLTQQTNTLAGDISNVSGKIPGSTWGLH